MYKKITLFLFVFLATTKAFALTHEKKQHDFAVKIAVVDVESIFEHSVAIKDIRDKINKISNRIQSEMSSKEVELKKLEEELIKQKGIITDAEFQEKVTEFNKRVSKAQQLLQSRKTALDQAHSEAISAVHSATVGIISELAKKYGFNMVLPSTQIIYVGNELNITLEVITQLNESLKTIELKYNPKDI